MNLLHCHAFAVTLRHGTITAAAAELGLSRPTLSRHLAALERELGLALLHRSTRQVRATPAGRRLFEQIGPVLQDLARVEAGMVEERNQVSGLLRVSVPPVIAPEIGQLLMRLMDEHPQLHVELLADIRWAELRSDGVEVAVRAGRIQDPDLIHRWLGSGEVSAVASPAYLTRRGAPAALADLAAHRVLRGHGPDGLPQRWWPLRAGGRVPVDGPFASNDQQVLLEAALGGGGIALVSEVISGPALASEKLQRVLPSVVGTRLNLHAVYARRSLQPARVKVFVNAAADWFGAQQSRYGA